MTIKKEYFITVEGIEGVGKSTAMRFMQQLLMRANVAHKVTREPGGTKIAEQIRQILLHEHNEIMAADTELLLMFASRAQHLAEVILPALHAGKWVLCDRFTDATYAYQGGGRGIDTNRIGQIEQWVQGNLRPDYVLLLDAPVSIALQRIQKRPNHDRIEREQEHFFTRVREMYLSQAKQYPERYKIIDASQSFGQVQHQIRQIFLPLLG